MFTGIVEELGEIVGVVEQATPRACTVRGPLVTSDARPGDSIAVNGVCLTVVEPDRATTFTVDVMARDAARAPAWRAPRPATRVNLERAVRRRRPARRAHRAGPRRRRGHVARAHRATRRDDAALPAWPRRARPLHRREGLDRGGRRVRSPSPRSTTTRSPSGSSRPRCAATTLGERAVAITVNLEVDVVAKYVERLAAALPEAGDDREPEVGGIVDGFEHIERAIADIAGGQGRRRRRRRGPRERGRSDLRGRDGHAGAGGVHGALHLRLHLRAADRARLRPAGPAADAPHQPGPPRHRVHRHRGRARRHQHRHLGHRPRAHHPPAGRPGGRARPTSRAPATSSAAGPRRRRPAPARAHRGRGRPGAPGRAGARPACSARSSRRRTTATWRAATSCRSSPTSTTSR